MRKMNPEEERVALNLFHTEEKDREGVDRLTVKFDPSTLTLWKLGRPRRAFTGLTLLHYTEGPARTPTGGRYTARRLTVRTRDGRKWWGTVKNGTNVVKLRLATEEK